MNYLLITIYIIMCFFFAMSEGRLKSRDRVSVFIFFAVLFSLEFAFRDIDKTRDTINYVEVFNAVSISDGLFERYDRYEPGFCFINRIVKLFVDDYRCLFFVIPFIIFMLWLWVLKLCHQYVKYGDHDITGNNQLKSATIYPLSFFAVYIPYFGLLYNSIALRAGLELALLYISILFFLRDKHIYAIIVYLLTITIHQSAIIALPLMVLAYRKFRFTKVTATRLFFVSLFLYIIGLRRITAELAQFIVSALSERFPALLVFSWSDHYLGEASADYGISLFRVSFFLITFLLIYNENSKRVNTFTSLSLISLIISALFGGFSILNRFTEMFLISCCISINLNLNYFSEGNLQKSHKKLFFLLLPMVLFYYGYLSNCL